MSFNEFLKLGEKAQGVKGKIESMLARLDRFSTENGVIEERDKEQRRVILFETLDGIKDKLLPVFERSSAVDYRENNADIQMVSGLAEDIKDAIIEYQFSQQKSVHEQNCTLIAAAELSVLNNCRRARDASYLHGERSGCLKGTREDVLNEIEQWAEDFDQFPIFWLHGLAGTGKSTIARTICERLFADGNLGASFFCFRGSEDRSDLQLIFPTLAFQLAQRFPRFRSSLVSTLKSDPDVPYGSLQDQMEQLLLKPLQFAEISTVIVIDALDEVKDEDPESSILPLLGMFARDTPKVKFFITSRPEAHIAAGFDGPLRSLTDVLRLHEVEPSTVNHDIRCFLKYQLSILARRRGGLEGWPTDEHLDLLCQRAAGLFVCAVATVKFLDHHLEDPSDQLKTILESPGGTVQEGGAKLKVYDSLDSLYTSILRMSFRKNKAKDDEAVRSVLSWVVLAKNPLSPSAIGTLTDFGYNKVKRILDRIQSLLVLSQDPDHPVRLFHKSFPDFLTDRNRCTDSRFLVTSDLHASMFKRCVDLIGESMEKTMFPTLDVKRINKRSDLPTIDKSNIHSALRYACDSWGHHLVITDNPAEDTLLTLHDFLERKFLFCLTVVKNSESLSYVTQRKAVDKTVVSLEKACATDRINALLYSAKEYRPLMKRLLARNSPLFKLFKGMR